MQSSDVLKKIGQLKIVPVVALESPDQAAPLSDALIAGGLPIIEITFRTVAAQSAIQSLCKRSDLLVGAGTVLNIDTVKKAVDAGAKFIVSPGFNPKVVSYCVQQGIPITPGACTPTEIEMALDHGLTAVKFFPCEAMGGLKMLKAIAPVFGMMKFMPTGGITAENLLSYLQFPPVLACGGSWIVTKELISAKRFDDITDLTRKAVAIAAQSTPTK
jgi:2-dehydro-3-deoxyphosphogluconate aldolase/(4S)-4-hydroxy-2-oxoglutarate aldolase